MLASQDVPVLAKRHSRPSRSVAQTRTPANHLSASAISSREAA